MSTESSTISPSTIFEGYATSEWLIFGLYLFVSLFAILGNSFIIFVIVRGRHSSNTFLLIANQSISDLLCGVVFISLWFFCSSRVIQLGLIGVRSCEVAMVLKLSTFFVSSLTMMALAKEQHRVVFNPNSSPINPVSLISAIWLIGLLIGVWTMLNYQITEFFTKERLFGCRRAFEESICTR